MKKIVNYFVSVLLGVLIVSVASGIIISSAKSTAAVAVTIALSAIISSALVFLFGSIAIKRMRWFEEILDSIPFPISVTDIDMKWTFINKPVEEMLKVKRDDVIGNHCSNWGAAICKTKNCGINCLHGGKQLTYFEQGGMDFQVNVSYLTEKNNKIGHIEVVQDISKTVSVQKKQTELINNVANASETFLKMSEDIAYESQGLAQGATEQAAAVEELSAVINEVAQRTIESAGMADSAADLAGKIKSSAERGNEQMNNMMMAVKEISDASDSIKKVIKVIDDIAFQTNILALNAAVEAARAGEQGKGFAVVADEVRSLAAKSAEAAKDTESLIANSMVKSELGVRIANETAVSLTEIVTGINQSNELVKNIARTSEEQSVSLSQINEGIEQVAKVVQQNSAASEKSASSSATMSERVIELNDMVREFQSIH